MALPTSPFSPVPLLLLSAPDSHLKAFLDEAHGLVVGCPALVADVEADLDAHARSKKAMRVADSAWAAARTALLPGQTSAPTMIDPARLTLGRGRPRTPAYVVLMAVLLRGVNAHRDPPRFGDKRKQDHSLVEGATEQVEHVGGGERPQMAPRMGPLLLEQKLRHYIPMRATSTQSLDQ